MIWAKHCSLYTTNLSNKNGLKIAFFILEIFSALTFSTQLLWYARPLCVGLRLNSCLCNCQRMPFCHSLVQLPARIDLRGFGQSIGPNTQSTYQKDQLIKRNGGNCVNIFFGNICGTRSLA
jgi:hypothetical protein